MSLANIDLGKELYSKATLELGAEKSIAEAGAELAVLSSLDKVEVEVKEEKRFGIKRKRVEVKNYDDFIKSLDSYTKLNNQILTPEEVVYALKDLEEEAEGSLREKIRALRKEVEEREGISKRGRNSLILLGILGAGFALGGLAWYLNQDHKPPEIKKVDYKDRVKKGEEQEVSIKVFEENPGEAYLRFNSSSIQIPLIQKFGNGTAFYKTSFDPANILAREGLFNAELIVKDKAGNEAKQSLSFLANLQPPVFKDLKLEKVDLGKYEISLSLEEENLKEAYVLVGGRKIPLTKYGDKLFGQVDLNCNKDFEVKAEDAFGLSSSLKGEASLSEADKLELSLYCSSPLFREIYSKDKALADSILNLAKSNSSDIPKNLAYQVLDQIERDSRVKDKIYVARNAFEILNELQMNNLIHKSSLYIPGNYSQALAQGLPKHSASDIKRLFDASENCEDIVDFEPIIIKDAIGQKIRIESKDLVRDYWILTEFLKNRPEIASQPKKFEWINRMMQQIAWDIFENPYGPNAKWIEPTTGETHLPENLKPYDDKVWEVILSFHDYMDSLPEKLERDGIEVIFPYHDSDLLRQYIADKTNRTIALFYLADVPAATADKATSQIISGINAMKKFVEQLPLEYNKLVNARNDPTIISKPAFSGTQYEWAMLYWQQWKNDRGGHGLAHTVEQFNQIDQFLSKSYKAWEQIKFKYGYKRFKSGDWGGEWGMYRYGLPLAYKAFGIPHGAAPLSLGEGLNILDNPDLVNKGAPDVEWAVSLPDHVVLSLKQNFPDIVIGYGNYFGLYSCKNGLDKDGATGIYQLIRGNHIDEAIYLWKK